MNLAFFQMFSGVLGKELRAQFLIDFLKEEHLLTVKVTVLEISII